MAWTGTWRTTLTSIDSNPLTALAACTIAFPENVFAFRIRLCTTSLSIDNWWTIWVLTFVAIITTLFPLKAFCRRIKAPSAFDMSPSFPQIWTSKPSSMQRGRVDRHVKLNSKHSGSLSGENAVMKEPTETFCREGNSEMSKESASSGFIMPKCTLRNVSEEIWGILCSKVWIDSFSESGKPQLIDPLRCKLCRGTEARKSESPLMSQCERVSVSSFCSPSRPCKNTKKASLPWEEPDNESSRRLSKVEIERSKRKERLPATVNMQSVHTSFWSLNLGPTMDKNSQGTVHLVSCSVPPLARRWVKASRRGWAHAFVRAHAFAKLPPCNPEQTRQGQTWIVNHGSVLLNVLLNVSPGKSDRCCSNSKASQGN